MSEISKVTSTETDLGFFIVEKDFTIQHMVFTTGELVKLKETDEDEVRICRWLNDPRSSVLFPKGLKDYIRRINYEPYPNFKFDFEVKNGKYRVTESFVTWSGNELKAGDEIKILSYKSGYVRLLGPNLDLIGVKNFHRLKYVGE